MRGSAAGMDNDMLSSPRICFVSALQFRLLRKQMLFAHGALSCALIALLIMPLREWQQGLPMTAPTTTIEYGWPPLREMSSS